MGSKSGLIMEGGAMRGMFTAGAIDVLMEHGVTFDGAVGVSAGAAFGCNYKSHQPGRAVRYNLRYCKDPRYCSIRSFLRTGDLYGAEFCYHTLPYMLDPFDFDTYNRDPMVFYVACTDARTGKPVYRRCDKADDLTFAWMRASASMPMVSRPVEIGDRMLLDGGISDSIPFVFMETRGYNRNLVILTRPRDYVKKPSSMGPLVRRLLRDYPKTAEAMARRAEAYNRCREQLFRREKAGEIFVLCPEKALPIHRIEHDPAKIQTVYDLGRAEMDRRRSELLEFLKG